MTTRLRAKAASILLAIVGTALSGTIAFFVLITVHLATSQLSAAGEAERRSRSLHPLPPIDGCGSSGASLCPRHTRLDGNKETRR